MMQQAKYIVQIPTVDNHGNQLKDLARAAHESLFRYAPGSKVEGTRIRRGIEGNWRDDPVESFDDLEVYAEDSPEMDSIMKQLGAHVAEVANQWGVMVFKEGDGAPQYWMMNHPNADGSGPADEAAIAQPASPILSALRTVA